MKEKSLYKIYIDTTDRNNTVVVLEEMQSNGLKEIFKKEGRLDVTFTIKEFLEKQKITLDDVTEIDSNLGPGSFTGLRVSSTIENILNWVLGKKKTNELRFPNYGGEPNITPPKKFKL